MKQQIEREIDEKSKKIAGEIDALSKIITTENEKSSKVKSAKASASCASQKEQDAEKIRKEIEMVERAQLLLKEAGKQGREAARERQTAAKHLRKEENKIVQKTIKRAAEDSTKSKYKKHI